MNKSGYLIARNRKADTFFTASSAYDRPNWLPIAEATVYATAELAQVAFKKLLRGGAYEARMLPLQEAIELDMPDEELPPEDGDISPTDDMSSDVVPPEDDPEMTASDQDTPCDVCDHCPCTCDPDEDGVDDIVNAELSGDDLPSDGGEDDSSVVGDELPPLEDDLPSMRESASEAEVIKFNDPAVLGNTNTSVKDSNFGEHEEKCVCPSEVLSALQKVIDEVSKDAELCNTRDDTKASFCLTVAEALKTLKGQLALGTVAGVKAAQIEMTSWMNPITVHVPVAVQKFIFMGGRKPTLKDMFNTKRDEKRGGQ